MESGITVREYKMCAQEFTSWGATNMRGYEEVRERELKRRERIKERGEREKEREREN